MGEESSKREKQQSTSDFGKKGGVGILITEWEGEYFRKRRKKNKLTVRMYEKLIEIM